MSENKSAAEVVGRCVFGVAQLAAGIGVGLLVAVVAQAYWRWFVAPTFGVATPPMLTVYGLVLLARLAAGTVSVDKYQETDEQKARRVPVWERTFQAALFAALTWGLGWVVFTLSVRYPDF